MGEVVGIHAYQVKAAEKKAEEAEPFVRVWTCGDCGSPDFALLEGGHVHCSNCDSCTDINWQFLDEVSG